eukprot:g4472.t1
MCAGVPTLAIATSATYVEQSDPIAYTPAADIKFHTNLTSAIVTLDHTITGDEFVVSYQSPTIEVERSSNVVTLSGDGPVSEWEKVLRSFTFQSVAENDFESTRTVTATTQVCRRVVRAATAAGHGVDACSKQRTTVITVRAFNDKPCITFQRNTTNVPFMTATYTQSTDAIRLLPPNPYHVCITDPDHEHIQRASITLGEYSSGDVLHFPVMVAGVATRKEGATWHVYGKATLEQYESILSAVKYASTVVTGLHTATRTASFKVVDPGGKESDEADLLINVCSAAGHFAEPFGNIATKCPVGTYQERTCAYSCVRCEADAPLIITGGIVTFLTRRNDTLAELGVQSVILVHSEVAFEGLTQQLVDDLDRNGLRRAIARQLFPSMPVEDTISRILLDGESSQSTVENSGRRRLAPEAGQSNSPRQTCAAVARFRDATPRQYDGVQFMTDGASTAMDKWCNISCAPVNARYVPFCPPSHCACPSADGKIRIKFSVVANDASNTMTIQSAVRDVLSKPAAAVQFQQTVEQELVAAGQSIQANFTAVLDEDPEAEGAGVFIAPAGVVAYEADLLEMRVQLLGSANTDKLYITRTHGLTNENVAKVGGTVHLMGRATPEVYQAALRSILFTTDDPFPKLMHVKADVCTANGQGDICSKVADSDVQTVDLDLAPQCHIFGKDGLPHMPVFTQGGNALQLAPHLELADKDSEYLQWAKFSVANNQAGDVLSVTPPTYDSDITVDYNAATGVLLLSGNASLAEYQALLRTVTYRNELGARSDTAPGLATIDRQLVCQASDGTHAGGTAPAMPLAMCTGRGYATENCPSCELYACTPAGQYKTSTDSLRGCTGCAAGQYGEVVGAYAPTSCKQCPVGKYQAHDGQGSCTACCADCYSDPLVPRTSSAHCKACTYGSWGPFSDCSKSCTGPDKQPGKRVRVRKVLSPGTRALQQCRGSDVRTCALAKPCPQDCAHVACRWMKDHGTNKYRVQVVHHRRDAGERYVHHCKIYEMGGVGGRTDCMCTCDAHDPQGVFSVFGVDHNRVDAGQHAALQAAATLL